jgi:hypothetical protein
MRNMHGMTITFKLVLVGCSCSYDDPQAFTVCFVLGCECRGMNYDSPKPGSNQEFTTFLLQRFAV